MILIKKISYKIKSQFFKFIETQNLILPNTVSNKRIEIKGSKVYANVNGEDGSKILHSIIGNEIKIGNNSTVNDSKIFGNTKLGFSSFIQSSNISGNFQIGDKCKIKGANTEGEVIVDDYSSLWGPNINVISNQDFPIRIGKFCSIARNVTLQSFNHNFKKISGYYIGRNLFKESWDNEIISKGEIIIKNDVWIGTHCVILGGISIGNGAVIAANSLVNKDVPDYAIVAGSPAKIIGYRFSENIISELLKIKWWDWSIEKIISEKKLFQNQYADEELISIIKNYDSY